MSKPNRKPVRMQQFKEQWTEQVLPADRLREVVLDENTSVWVKLPVLLEEGDDFAERMQAASSEKDVCLVILSGHPDLSAEDQWETFRSSGYGPSDLLAVFGALRAEAQEAVQRFRYKG